MNKGLLFFISLLSMALLLASVQAKKEFTAPEGLVEELEQAITSAWEVSISDAGWSSKLNAPKYEFSTAASSHQVRLEVLGDFLRGALALKNSGLVAEEDLQSRIDLTAEEILKWQWVPQNNDWGVANSGSFPSGETTYVRSETRGIVGANVECKDHTVAFNEWAFPKGSKNFESQTHSGHIGSATAAVLAAIEAVSESQLKNHLTSAGKNSVQNLLTMVVTPEEESFGVHQSILTEKSGGKIAIGMLPGELKAFEGEDTKNCSDGAYIKYQKVYKHEVLQGAVAFSRAFDVTGKEEYKRAAQHVFDGVLSLRECDGLIKSYAQFKTPYATTVTCYPEGEDTFEKYSSSVLTFPFKEIIYDTGLSLWLIQEANPKAYTELANFKDTLSWLEELEEKYAGVGLQRKKGFEVRHASNYINPDRRAAIQAMEAALFLRAACQIKDNAELRSRFAETSYKVAEKAFASANLDMPSKPRHALASDTGKHMLGLKALVEVHEILTVGCSTAPDLDDDGYYDDPNELEPDCDDQNASIYPGAIEVCDAVDNDCDDIIDEGFDQDNDNFTSCGGDCDDADGTVYPGATELINKKDDNCNDLVDERSIVIDTVDENGSKLVDINIFFFLYGNEEKACADDYNESDFTRIKSRCTLDASCLTNVLGVCSIVMPAQNYLAVFEDVNGLTSKRVELTDTNISRIELRKMVLEEEDLNAEAELEESDLNQAAAPGILPGIAFPNFFEGLTPEMSFILTIVLILAIVLIVVAVIVVGVIFYLLKKPGVKAPFKEEKGWLPKPAKPKKSPEQELDEYRGKFAFRKKDDNW